MLPMIYVDDCNTELEKRIYNEIGIPIVKRMHPSSWNVGDVMAIITDPRLELAVINVIDEAALMEISLLHFMCKPILVTHQSIKQYPLVEKTIDFVDLPSNMKTSSSNFINWYNWWDSTR